MILPRTVFLAVVAFQALHLTAQTRTVTVNANQVWTDTGIDLRAGQTLTMSATGSVQVQNGKTSAPEGLPKTWTDMLMQLPVTDAGDGALIGRFGSSPAARPFLVGPRTQRGVPIDCRLFLGINENSKITGTGSYSVTIQVSGANQTQSNAAATPLPAFTQQMLDSIPLRVQDAQGNVGDRVNFVLIGSQDQVQSALRNAGWVIVDKTKRDAVIRGLLTSLSKDAYVTLPMSELELFGRVQDFGYAQADPIRVVASRHHFRLWRTPFTAGGEMVWAGAGTHDIGFDKDQRNNGITHKIDPATDGERDYIGESLQQTGQVVKKEYLMPSHPVKEARTATGGGFTSDGRTLILYFKPENANYGVQFASTFCSVLASNPDGGTWNGCKQYLEGANAGDVKPLAPLTPDYHVVIVPGFLSSCFSDAPAFQKGAQVLHDKYGFAVDTIPVTNDASTSNAKTIAQFISSLPDSKKVILVGYSKGSPDIYEALQTNPALTSRVAAFVSVAGAIGGSPIASLLPQQAEKWIKQFNLSGCRGDINSGFKSLARDSRQAFLASYPQANVPSYSLVAESSREITSKSLVESWLMLQSYGSAEDGQLLREDAIVPGSKFLGAMLADHFAAALPFESSKQTYMEAGMDKNHYPRAALFESIVRFVSDDLRNGKH